MQGVGGHLSAHPDYLRTMLNRRQIYEWMTYSNLFPFGDERNAIEMSHQTYHIRQSIYEAMTGEQPECQPSDFMPQFDNESSAKTEAQVILDEIKGMLT